MDNIEGMISASVDQDWAAAVDLWDGLTPEERGELGEYLVGRRDLDDAPDWAVRSMVMLAQIAYVETAFRWATREESP